MAQRFFHRRHLHAPRRSELRQKNGIDVHSSDRSEIVSWYVDRSRCNDGVVFAQLRAARQLVIPLMICILLPSP